MRGIGTLYAGLVILTALAALTIYMVYTGRIVIQSIHEQQMLYEKARFIAEHVNISGDIVELPEPADLIIIDPNGVPHVAENVTRLQLPWSVSQSKIYIAVTGRLRVGAADPVATALSMAASVAAAPLQAGQSAGSVTKDFCASYLDPVLYHAAINSGLSAIDAAQYRGYVPADNYEALLFIYLMDPFYLSPLPDWDKVVSTYKLPVTKIVYMDERRGNYLYVCHRPFAVALFGRSGNHTTVLAHMVVLANGTVKWNWFGIWRTLYSNVLCVYNGTLFANGTLVLQFQKMLPRYEDSSIDFNFNYSDGDVDVHIAFRELYDFGSLWYYVFMNTTFYYSKYIATASFISEQSSPGGTSRTDRFVYNLYFNGVCVIDDGTGTPVLSNTYSGSSPTSAAVVKNIMITRYEKCTT